MILPVSVRDRAFVADGDRDREDIAFEQAGLGDLVGHGIRRRRIDSHAGEQGEQTGDGYQHQVNTGKGDSQKEGQRRDRQKKRRSQSSHGHP